MEHPFRGGVAAGGRRQTPGANRARRLGTTGDSREPRPLPQPPPMPTKSLADCRLWPGSARRRPAGDGTLSMPACREAARGSGAPAATAQPSATRVGRGACERPLQEPQRLPRCAAPAPRPHLRGQCRQVTLRALIPRLCVVAQRALVMPRPTATSRPCREAWATRPLRLANAFVRAVGAWAVPSARAGFGLPQRCKPGMTSCQPVQGLPATPPVPGTTVYHGEEEQQEERLARALAGDRVRARARLRLTLALTRLATIARREATLRLRCRSQPVRRRPSEAPGAPPEAAGRQAARWPTRR